jgi:two-component system, chemotaxis family, CheB/CheR fusion protein
MNEKGSIDRGHSTLKKERSIEFPIVGIGASAGGLEALDAFLGNVPENSGIAFIIVQHQDPTSKGILVELLQRATPMEVVQVKEKSLVKPNCVYIIPPNKDMSILHGEVHLSDCVAPRGLRLPIDFFFRSLAEHQQENSIGVILSGMGTDGTLGLRAIKEKGGGAFVQEPTSAKFDSMPRSAIKDGFVDVVSPVEDLPAKIVAYLQHKAFMRVSDPGLTEEARSAFDKIVMLLRAQTGHDFSAYKKTTVCRRIERRMGIHQIEHICNYVSYLQENPEELQRLFKELLIGVTSFFREPEEWDLLKEKVIPALLAKLEPGQALRAWVSACATGEEAYSLAIVFKEVLEQFKPSQTFSLQIFATDLDHDAIDKAREATFPANIAAEVSPERLSRYFVEVDQGYQVVKSIRDMVIFAPQNVIMDPPFTKIDILSCRNLLIYLTAELQKKLLPLFHYSLNPGGFLFLGSAETVGTFTDIFQPVHSKSRLYQRLPSLLQEEAVEFPVSFVPSKASLRQRLKPVQDIQPLADQLILQCYAPPTVLVNGKGDILYITGRTGKYLEPAPGQANWNIFAMAREGLHFELSETFQKAIRKKEAVTFKNAVVTTNGGAKGVDIIVQPLLEPEGLKGLVMVVFKDTVMPPQAKEIVLPKGLPERSQREAELERELMQARQELQSTHIAMQSSHEELKSFNEELQSTNEELQSTNEELTTSKEEMQSLNEELQTVNYELQGKVDELSMVNNDMKNLLNSTEIGTLFLNNELQVRRFTSEMSVITNLIPGDIGRPVTDIASELFYPELPKDVKEVLRTLNTVEKLVSAGGRWFNVRILPYRTLDDKIDGVVVTFVDTTDFKTLENQLLKTQAAMENRLTSQDTKLAQANARLQNEIKKGQREVAAGDASQEKGK